MSQAGMIPTHQAGIIPCNTYSKRPQGSQSHTGQVHTGTILLATVLQVSIASARVSRHALLETLSTRTVSHYADVKIEKYRYFSGDIPPLRDLDLIFIRLNDHSTTVAGSPKKRRETPKMAGCGGGSGKGGGGVVEEKGGKWLHDEKIVRWWHLEKEHPSFNDFRELQLAKPHLLLPKLEVSS
ncbi:hypothetical protein ElyMa_001047100 [Elysia marginata]|uniref:Uncharacterized protein n=1 Tax=Elysia marginata TaxID=1093978 RepID=A0AAV4HS62_9GAST|nr:hypothetical protein ElyMa_001047100 [Elysia marginata]